MKSIDYSSLSKEELIDILEKLNGKAKADRISYPQDVLPFISKYKKKKQEHFVVLGLNGQHQVIYTKVTSIGTVNRTIVHARDIFREAIKKNCAAIILAHNHPSGDPQPSPEDDKVTYEIKKAGDIVGITVLDHVIIGTTYYSYLEKDRL